MDRYECDTCGQFFPLKKDGNLWRHKDHYNKQCSGSPVTGEVTEVAAVGKGEEAPTFTEKGGSYEAAEEPTPAEPEPEPTSSKSFEKTYVVKMPAEKVYESWWKSKKAKTFASDIRNAGRVPVGGTTQVKSIEEDHAARVIRVTFSAECE